MLELEVPQKEPTRKETHRERDRDRSGQFMGLSKKSSSTSQLSATGKVFFVNYQVLMDDLGVSQ